MPSVSDQGSTSFPKQVVNLHGVIFSSTRCCVETIQHNPCFIILSVTVIMVVEAQVGKIFRLMIMD